MSATGEVVRGLAMGNYSREWLDTITKDDTARYSTTPRGCRCIGGPLRNPSEDIVTCVRCGAVLSQNGAGR